jgi:gamma-glutamylcyclotransferase (GGCT)/AIG2-like uncharacterized protein YtfP
VRRQIFVYGCLLEDRLLRDLAPSMRFVGSAFARGYRLMFSHVAYLVPDDDARTFGAVFEVDEDELRIIDCFEGASYTRRPIIVDTPWDELVAEAYVAEYPYAVMLTQSPPRPGYLREIVAGYRALHAPVEAAASLTLSVTDSVTAADNRTYA